MNQNTHSTEGDMMSEVKLTQILRAANLLKMHPASLVLAIYCTCQQVASRDAECVAHSK